MQKRFTRHLLILALSASLTLLSGCLLLALTAAVGAGITGAAYVGGEMSGFAESTPVKLKPIIEKVFKRLKITKTSSSSDAMETMVKGRSAGGDTVKVTAKLQKDGRSKIYVRVGTFGDKAFSVQILNEISRYLPRRK